jgi:CTP:molybdopterin cytidylyltransferase MocA
VTRPASRPRYVVDDSPARARGPNSGRARKAVVVLVGDQPTVGQSIFRLLDALDELGVATTYLGREHDGARIAATAAGLGADTVEVCIAGCGGVRVLRELLRELIALDRGNVSIVVHRVR